MFEKLLVDNLEIRINLSVYLLVLRMSSKEIILL